MVLAFQSINRLAYKVRCYLASIFGVMLDGETQFELLFKYESPPFQRRLLMASGASIVHRDLSSENL